MAAVFGNCPFFSFTSIDIPDSVDTIGKGAFDGCRSLECITVNEANLNYSSQDGILYDKAKTKFVHVPNAIKGAVTIPDSITAIGSSMFSGCSKLKEVSIGSSVTSIGERAFYNCSGLKSVEIPDSVTSIGERAFYNCSGLQSVTIGRGVTSIGSYAFSSCSNLQSVTFRDPNGWSVVDWRGDTIPIDPKELQDPATAANYLTNGYRYYKIE